jgi:hypothetical protein
VLGDRAQEFNGPDLLHLHFKKANAIRANC